MADTIIPGDARNKALYLYHPSIAGAKRIDISKQDPDAQQKAREEIAALKREGWTEQRFAQVVFHKKLGQKVVTDETQLPVLKKQGWQTEPFGVDEAHPDARHPHYADEHRKIYLEQQAEESKSKK